MTVTLAPDADEAFKITLQRAGATLTAQEGTALLSDPASLAKVVDGMAADLLAAEHETS